MDFGKKDGICQGWHDAGDAAAEWFGGGAPEWYPGPLARLVI